MADFVFNQALGARGDDWVGATVRSGLLKTKEADDALRDQDFVSGVVGGSNVEADCTGYTGPGTRYDLGSKARTVDDTNNRVDYDAADVAFGALGNGTNNAIVGIFTYKFVTNDAASIPISWHDLSFTTDGSSVTVQWATDGVWRAAG